MSTLLSIAILSLFTPFKIATGLVQIRPFDVLAGVALAWALTRGKTFPRGGLQIGVLVLLPYFVWHVVSALTVSTTNGLREGLQLLTVLGFVWALSVELDDLDYRRVGRVLLLGMTIITAWSIGWHIANGYWTGWKRLIDPKSTFTFLPPVLACMLIVGNLARRHLWWMAWVCLGLIVFFSGERKALIVFGILTAALIARGRLLSSLYVIAGAFAVLVLLSDLVDDPYLSRQIRTVTDPVETGDFTTAIATGEAATGDTRSNAQRGFAIALARELISQNLVFGVGTNAYEQIVETRFAYLPSFLRSGIHGEFLRVLTENGLVGLVAYLAIWLVTSLRTRAVLRRAVHQRLLTASQAALLQIVIFVPCLLYISFEASGTHSLIVLSLVSLLPDGIHAWLKPAPLRRPLPAMRTAPPLPAPRLPAARLRRTLGTTP